MTLARRLRSSQTAPSSYIQIGLELAAVERKNAEAKEGHWNRRDTAPKRGRKRRHADTDINMRALHKHPGVHELTHRWKNENKRARWNAGHGEARTKGRGCGVEGTQFIAFKAASVDSARRPPSEQYKPHTPVPSSGQRRIATKRGALRRTCSHHPSGRARATALRPARICAVAALIYSNAPKDAPQRGRCGRNANCAPNPRREPRVITAAAPRRVSAATKGSPAHTQPRASSARAPLFFRTSFRPQFSVG